MELLRDLNEGREQALEEIYRLFFHALCAFGTHFVKKEVVVADIVQEIFIKVWARRTDFHSIYSLRSFMYISVRNACLNYNRNSASFPCIPLETKENMLAEEEEEYVIEEEFYRLIQQEVNKLPDAVRKVFDLTLLDMSVAEIARVLELSENTVRNQRARAREILRKNLKGKLFSFLFL